MADKDITGFSEFFDIWLPTRIKSNVEPILASAEDTLDKSHSIVRQNLRNQLVPLITSLKGSEAKVLDTLSDKISSSEAKLDDFHNTVINRLDTRLAPLESNISLQSDIPSFVIPGSATLPGGVTMLKPYPGFPGGEENIPPSVNGGPIAQIQNQPIPPQQQQIENCPIPPECPPIECPPIPPCPLPGNPHEFCIWFRPCITENNVCAYIMPREYPPLNQGDVLAACLPDPEGENLFQLYQEAAQYCEHHAPVCEVNPMGLPPIPAKPGGICCPPAIIQNIMNPPQGQIQNIQPPAGGQIQNIINIPNPIINEPLPPISPRPPITGFGQIVNDIIVQIKDKLKWRPTGDFAYLTDQDNDESGFQALWKELGIDITGTLGGNTLKDYTQKFIDDNPVNANY